MLDLLCVDTNNLSARVAGRDDFYCRDEKYCQGCVQSIVDAIGTYIAFKLCRGERIAVPVGRGIRSEELVSFIKELLEDRGLRERVAKNYLSRLGECIEECLYGGSRARWCGPMVRFAGVMYDTIYDTVLKCGGDALNRVATFNADEHRGKLEKLLGGAGDLHKDEDFREWIEPCIAYYLDTRPQGGHEGFELATLDHRAATDVGTTACLIVQRKIQSDSCTSRYLCELCDLGAVADLYH